MRLGHQGNVRSSGATTPSPLKWPRIFHKEMEETTPRSVFPRAGLGRGPSRWSLKQAQWEPLRARAGRKSSDLAAINCSASSWVSSPILQMKRLRCKERVSSDFTSPWARTAACWWGLWVCVWGPALAAPQPPTPPARRPGPPCLARQDSWRGIFIKHLIFKWKYPFQKRVPRFSPVQLGRSA